MIFRYFLTTPGISQYWPLSSCQTVIAVCWMSVFLGSAPLVANPANRELIPLIFSRLPRSPSPSPITPATQATLLPN